jgi:NO-binding membrane sensor protein with MHYT domain
MQGILYDDSSLFVFILVTIVLGGSAGYSSGKAIAQTWRPGWHLVASALVLGVAVRFLHYGLFGASFLTPHYYTIDTVLVLLAAFAGFRLTRVKQMTTRYRWLYQATGPFAWKSVASGESGPEE